ncbi:MAG: PBP1A family penicillin-binding protein [Kofleriaceae bacterium]
MWAPSGDQTKPGKPSKTTTKKAGRGTPPAKPKRPLWLQIVKWCAIVGFSGLVLMIATVAFVFWMYGRDKNLPDPRSLSDIKHRQVTWIVDKNDHRIGTLFGEPKMCALSKAAAPPPDPNSEDDSLGRRKPCDKDDDCDSGKCEKAAEHETRTFVEYDKIPKILVDAFVATEDNKFWEHGGVDYWGMFRAFWANVRAGKSKQGASTITQQVVKNLLLTPEKTFKRKIQEIILARRLESALSKEEIISLYMNQINFGNARYGVQEASRFYFGKDVAQLDVGEAALLAGLPQSPEKYAPNKKKNYEAAKQRQIHVLNRLVEMGKLSAADAQKWIDSPIRVIERPFPHLNSAPEWVGLVKDELMESKCAGKSTCPEGELYLDTLGATVRTTLDPKLQDAAQHALQAGLRAVDKRKSYGRPKRSLKKSAVEGELEKLAKALPKGGPKKGEPTDAIVIAVHDDDKELEVDLGGYKAAVVLDDDRYAPTDDDGKPAAASTRFKPGDVVEVMALTHDKKPPKHAANRVWFPKGPEGAVVILEVKTRKVRALVGGYASKTLGINRATDAHRQPGSSFKPYVFAAGIELGAGKEKDEGGRITFTAGSPVNDAPDPRWEDRWNAKNYETGKFEGTVLLRYALSKSINTVAIRVLERVTPDKIIDLAKRVGIQSKLPTTLSLALGAGEVTPLETTNAMATFAAGGRAGKPVFIESIDGKATPPGETTEAVKPEVAYVVTNMMTSVVSSGTGILAAKLKIPIAGKTGTSNDARDVWFVGLTPDYAIGIWIGHDDPQSMGRETGGTTAVPVYVDIVKNMNLPAKAFPRPPHVVEAKIDRATGLLAPEGWPADKTMTEVFVEGTVPTEYATEEGNGVKGEYDE